MSLLAWIRARSSWLLSRPLLHVLFWTNLLGTIYGYEWYWGQMEKTVAEKPIWTVILVPDSPTASLFFTISVLWLLRYSQHDTGIANRPAFGWMAVQALAAVSSFKYGIWAVAIIVAGWAKGGAAEWQDWMLSVSHLGMAVEVLHYLQYYRIRPAGWIVAALWVFGSDLVDYTYDVYPWLPESLSDDVPTIAFWTVLLSAVSIAVMIGCDRYLKKRWV